MTNTDELNMNRKSNEYVIFQMSYNKCTLQLNTYKTVDEKLKNFDLKLQNKNKTWKSDKLIFQMWKKSLS